MSYLSSKDMAVLQPTAKLHLAAPNRATLRAPYASPVGSVLEIVLLVATNAALSLVFCTAVAGAILH